MNTSEKKAWELYCKETAGSMDVRDHWEELSAHMQRHYKRRVRELAKQPKMHFAYRHNPSDKDTTQSLCHIWWPKRLSYKIEDVTCQRCLRYYNPNKEIK